MGDDEGQQAGQRQPADKRQKLLRGQWRHEIEVRVTELEGRLAEARARDAVIESPEMLEQARAVQRALDEATRAIVPECTLWRRIQHWWTGAAVTHAWESVHAASAGVVTISSPDSQAEIVPRLRSWMRLVLPDARELCRYEEWFDSWSRDRERVEPIRLRQAHQAAIAANVEWHTSLRAFRNTLFYVAGGLFVLLAVLGCWHLIDTSIVPLCGRVNGKATCFGGASPPLSVLEVELVGAFGGLLSSTFLLAKLEKPPTRYNVLVPQIVLKAVAGAASALVGLLFLQSGLAVGPLHGTSAAVLLTYAILFGFSQQVITQLIDRQSATLLSPGGSSR